MTASPLHTTAERALERPPAPFADVARLVLSSALIAGGGEVALKLVARRILPTPIFLDPNAIWMAPLSALLVFAPLVVLAWGVGRMRSRRAAWLSAVTVAGFVAAFDVLMLLPRLHVLGLALLAAGVASQVVLVARRWPHLFARVTTVASVAFAAIVAIGAAGAVVFPTLRRGEAGANPVAGDDQPNVLLLVLDTVRALELSAYGYARATSPRLTKFAAEGVRFDRAVATAPWTLPTHATLLTGRYQHELSVGWTTPLDSVPATVPELFASAGYATGGFIANLRYCSREYGLGRGFAEYRDYALVGSQLVGSTMLGRRAIGAYNDLGGHYVLPGRKNGERVVDEFLGWHASLGTRPFFAMMNFFDAHEPYAPDAPYDRLFLPAEPPTRGIVEGTERAPGEVEGLRDAYDGAIASLDEQLGRLFDQLAQRGALDNTIVVVTSDHGEEFAEHGHLSHGNGLHFPALHVPLIVRWPAGGVPSGARVATPVTLRDVPATLLDLAGVPNERGVPGVSLASLWTGAAAGDTVARSPVLSELYWVRNLPSSYPVSGGNLRSLVRGRLHFIAGPGSREELYDIVDDPFEQRDLSKDAVMADTLTSLRAALVPFPMEDRGGR